MEATGSVSTPTSCPVPEPVPSSAIQVHPASSINTKVESITQSHLVSVPPCDREKGPKQPQTAHSFPQPCLRGQICSSESSQELCSKQQYSSSPSPSPQPAESSETDGCQGRGGMQTNSRVEGERGKKNSVPFTRKKKSDRFVCLFVFVFLFLRFYFAEKKIEIISQYLKTLLLYTIYATMYTYAYKLPAKSLISPKWWFILAIKKKTKQLNFCPYLDFLWAWVLNGYFFVLFSIFLKNNY